MPVYTSVGMTREEASKFMSALDGACIDCVTSIGKAKRARSKSPVHKAVVIENETQNLELLTALRERIGTVFNLGGY